MWTCPVCDTEVDGGLCTECGFDRSTDLTRAPTFCIPARMPEAPSALRAKLEAARKAAAHDPLEEAAGKIRMLTERLTKFYRREIAPVVDDPDVSYQQLLECAELFCDLQEMTELWEMIFHGAKRRAEENAKAAVERKLSMAEGGHSPLYVVLEDYNKFARRIEHNGRIPEAERTEIVARLDQDVKSVTERWVREYDRRFRQDFDPERMAEYEQFYNKDFQTSSLLRYSAKLLQKYLAASTGMIDVLLEFVEGGCLFITYDSDGAGIRKRTQLKPENAAEQKRIERSLYSYWADTEAVQRNIWMQNEIRRLDERASKKDIQDFREKDTKSFLFWERAARIRMMNPIWLMLEKGSVLLTDKVIMRSLAVNDCYWTDERLDSMISWCEECIRNGKAGAKGPLEILKKEREIRAELMESNRKQAEKEKKEREKPREETKKGGFWSRWIERRS